MHEKFIYLYTHEILFTYYILIFIVLKGNVLVIKFYFLYVSTKDPSYKLSAPR